MSFRAPALSEGSASNTLALHRRRGVKMTLRSVSDTIKSLHANLTYLEQTTDTARDSMDFAQLRRIFLKRIAEIEIERTRATSEKPDYKIAS